jgi:hypothetical protein
MVEAEIFALQKPYTSIGYPFEGGVSAYFGADLTESDLNLVQDCLKQEKIDILNTRAFKKEDHLIITVGSINTDKNRTVECKG